MYLCMDKDVHTDIKHILCVCLWALGFMSYSTCSFMSCYVVSRYTIGLLVLFTKSLQNRLAEL